MQNLFNVIYWLIAIIGWLHIFLCLFFIGIEALSKLKKKMKNKISINHKNIINQNIDLKYKDMNHYLQDCHRKIYSMKWGDAELKENSYNLKKTFKSYCLKVSNEIKKFEKLSFKQILNEYIKEEIEYFKNREDFYYSWDECYSDEDLIINLIENIKKVNAEYELQFDYDFFVGYGNVITFFSKLELFNIKANNSYYW
jgi:hypothetical protein